MLKKTRRFHRDLIGTHGGGEGREEGNSKMNSDSKTNRISPRSLGFQWSSRRY